MRFFDKTNKKNRFILFLFLLTLFLLTLFSKNKEGFTPKIKEMYRPYFRHARIYSENILNQISKKIPTFFRKRGLM